MGAGLAIVAIVGGFLSTLVVGPEGVLSWLATLSIGGSLSTVLVAALAAWRVETAETAAAESPLVQPPVASSPVAPGGS